MRRGGAPSSSGRTADFGSVNRGSNPRGAANRRTDGDVPEWSGSGLQNRLHGFDSRRRLHLCAVYARRARSDAVHQANAHQCAIAGGLDRLSVTEASTLVPSAVNDLGVLDRGGEQGSHGQETSEHLNVVRHGPMLRPRPSPSNHPFVPPALPRGVRCTHRRSGGMADAAGLNPAARKAWGFESLLRHQPQRRLKILRRCALRATAGCSMPMTTWATLRIAAVVGDCGRPTTSGTPSFTDRIMSTSV
jgi:hypothetical protein